MKNYLLPFYFLVFLFISCESGVEPDPLQDIYISIHQEVVQNSEAYKNLKEATEKIGHRLTGSSNGTEAEDFTYKLLQSYGIKDVRYQQFEMESWMRDSVSLLIDNETDLIKYKSVSLAHTPLKSNIEALLVDVHNGFPENYDSLGTDIKGNIALINLDARNVEEGRKNIPRSAKTQLAIEHGASGIIFINDVAGHVLITGTVSNTGNLVSIPVVCVCFEDGEVIRADLKTEEKVKASIFMINKKEAVAPRNVIATIPGYDPDLKNEKIVLGGHLDSWDLATGAMDNGIGSFSVIDVARTFVKLDLKPKRTVEFVLFMGEEQGLFGSKAYVKKCIEQNILDNIKCMVNMDMTTNARSYAIARTDLDSVVSNIAARVNKVDSTFKTSVRVTSGLSSDHQPFMIEGIPTMWFDSDIDHSLWNCYHSDCDNMDLIQPEYMVNNVSCTSMLILGLANTEDLQSPKLNQEEVRNYCIRHQLEEPMRINNTWRWD